MKKTNITNLVILFIIGVIVIAASWKFSVDVRTESEKRLHVEEGIAAAMNEQYLAAQKLKDERKAAQEEREFNMYLYGRTTPPPEVVQQQIERHLREKSEH